MVLTPKGTTFKVIYPRIRQVRLKLVGVDDEVDPGARRIAQRDGPRPFEMDEEGVNAIRG